MNTPAESGPPLTRVARRKARTNKRLLEVAQQVFAEKGIYWATVEDITELADQGKGTFYKYFDSKKALIRILLEEGLEDLAAKTEGAVRNASLGPKILSAAIEARVDFFLGHLDYLRLLHQVRGMMQLDVQAVKEWRESYDRHLRRLAQLIKPAMGREASGNAMAVATAMAAYTSGLLTYHILFDGSMGIKHRRNYLLRTLQRSLLPLLRNDSGSRKVASFRNETEGRKR